MGTSQLCLVVAMRVGTTGIVQQFRFAGILFAVLVGYCAFQEVPDLPAASGCMFILSAGAYSLVVSFRAQSVVKDMAQLECKPSPSLYGRCQLGGLSKATEDHAAHALKRVDRDSDFGCVVSDDPHLCDGRQSDSEVQGQCAAVVQKAESSGQDPRPEQKHAPEQNRVLQVSWAGQPNQMRLLWAFNN